MHTTDALKKRAIEINSFYLPKWEEIPEEPVMRKNMLAYIDEALRILYPEGEVLTGTMVQNYIKWNLVPAPVERRYGRVHHAYFIVLGLLKDLISLKYIKEGIALQTRVLELDVAYSTFCTLMESALKRATNFFLEDTIPDNVNFPGWSAPLETLNLAYACEALSLKLLAELFIKEQGLFGSLKGL